MILSKHRVGRGRRKEKLVIRKSFLCCVRTLEMRYYNNPRTGLGSNPCSNPIDMVKMIQRREPRRPINNYGRSSFFYDEPPLQPAGLLGPEHRSANIIPYHFGSVSLLSFNPPEECVIIYILHLQPTTTTTSSSF